MNTFEQHRQINYYRKVFSDLPVGDPMSGPMYNERLKSKGIGMVLGVVASVMTMGAAMPLMASTALASQIAGGAMMAGGIMTGVGTVTGNKKLMKVGGILSLAGGLGGAAISATGGASGSIGSSLGQGSQGLSEMSSSFMKSANEFSGGLLYSDAAKAGASAAADVASKGAEQGVSLAGDSAVSSAVVDPQTGITKLADAGTAPLSSDQVSALALDNSEAGVKFAGAADGGKAAGTIDIAGGPTNFSGQGATDAANKLTNAVPTPDVTVADKGILGRAGDFVKDNKELAKIGAESVRDFVKAGFGPDGEEKLKAEADLLGAQTSFYNTKEEAEKYKLANAKQQVEMIAADDPERAQKVAAAAAAGRPVAFIPTFGTPGGGLTGGNTAAVQGGVIAAQTPVRQPTYPAGAGA